MATSVPCMSLAETQQGWAAVVTVPLNVGCSPLPLEDKGPQGALWSHEVLVLGWWRWVACSSVWEALSLSCSGITGRQGDRKRLSSPAAGWTCHRAPGKQRRQISTQSRDFVQTL